MTKLPRHESDIGQHSKTSDVATLLLNGLSVMWLQPGQTLPMEVFRSDIYRRSVIVASY